MSRVVWFDTEVSGVTTDSYRVRVQRTGFSADVIMRVEPPRGSSLTLSFATVKAAKANAETEIEHHRRLGRWT